MTNLPRVHTNSQTVSLSFSSTLIQSIMSVADPDTLVLDYTRAMMAALLFNPNPRHVLMVGLGGGSMVKYLHRHVPEAHITVVEINPAVIDLRGAFQVPPDSERLHTICADGATFLAKPPRRYDLILVDGYDGEGVVAALCTRGFYTHCRKALRDEGLLVANVHADAAQSREIGKRLSKAFDGAVISVVSADESNDIAIAGAQHVFEQARAEGAVSWMRLDEVHRQTLQDVAPRVHQALQRHRPAG